MKILCQSEVIISEIDYFSFELEKLKDFEEDGLIKIQSSKIEVTPLGQFFLRNIASVFDFYLQNKNGKQKIYSKTV